jgi:hypothetical protein
MFTCLMDWNAYGEETDFLRGFQEHFNIKIIVFLGSKVRRVRKADNLTAIYEPIV